MNHLKAWFATLILTASLTAQEAPRKFDAMPTTQESASAASKPHEGFDDANARAEWMRQRMGGDPPPGFSQRVFREALKMREAFPQHFQRADSRLNAREALPAPLALPSWVSLGPTNADFSQNGSTTLNKIDSGRLRNILPHPTDPNIVYVLTSGGGLWKTLDFSSTYPAWTPLTDFVGSTSGGAAAFGRTPDILYLGLGDPLDGGGGTWSAGGSLVRSVDSGQTWSNPITFSNITGSVHDIGVDTSQAQDIVLVGTDRGLFRSTDGGQSLALVPSIPATHHVWSLVRTSTVWLAATRDMDSNSSNFQFGFLYQSNDRGATWTPTADPLMGSDPFGRFTLAVAQPGDATVYAYAANRTGSATFDLYVSLNGGASWTKKNLVPKVPTNPNVDQSNMDLMHDQAWYNHMILVVPTDATRNTVYLGGNLSSAKSTDGGATWQLVSNWLPRGSISLPYIHADFMCAAFQTAGGVNRVLVGNDGGLFISSDSGLTWDDRKNRGLNSTLIYSLAVNPNVPGSALIGLQDNGTRIRQGTTGTFNAILGGDGMGTGWAQGSGVSLGSYVYNQIYRSATSPPTDQNNFSDFVTGLGTIDGTNYYFVTPIYTPPSSADASGQVFFTYGNSGTGPNSRSIFKSNSTSWTKIGAAGTSPGFSSGNSVRSLSHGIAASPQDLNRIAAAGAGGTIIMTTNGGTSWTEPNLGAQVSGWNNFNSGVVWFNNNILYACSEAVAAGSVRVARSSTGGTSWTGAGTGLPDVPVTRLAMDPTDATGNSVYAGTWIGMYKTTNGGASWAPFGQGLPQVRITDIFVAPDGSFIRVGTYGRGVWEATLPGGAGGDTTTQLLLNPGFESGNTIWTVSNNDIINPSSVSGMQLRSGTWGAWISGYGVVHTDTLSQDVAVSAGATHVELNFWLKIGTQETGGVANDTLKVQIRNTSGVVLGTLATLSNLDAPTHGTFVKKSFDVTAYKGQTIRVYLEGVENASLATSFFVDDFELNATTTTATAPTITTQPQNQTVTVGQSASFTVAATGTAPLAYQWRRNGANIGGATNATYAFTASLADNGAQYSVVVSNGLGSATSANATLTANPKSGDMNGDGQANVLDLATLMAAYSGSGVPTSNPAADLDGDGDCDDADLALLLAGI